MKMNISIMRDPVSMFIGDNVRYTDGDKTYYGVIIDFCDSDYAVQFHKEIIAFIKTTNLALTRIRDNSVYLHHNRDIDFLHIPIITDKCKSSLTLSSQSVTWDILSYAIITNPYFLAQNN